MFGPSASQGYDRSSIMYSPDGRIIQTEYAREAMRKGSIALGLRSNKGVVLAGKLMSIDLDYPNSKISKIGNEITAIFSGYAADGRSLINRARVETAVHKMTYDEEIDVKQLALRLADYTHIFTQQGGLRPLGVGLLIGGVDKFDGEPRIYFINPGGGLTETRAKAIGDGDAKAMKYLKDKHKEKPIDEMTVDELQQLARDTIEFVTDEKLSDDMLEIWASEVKS
ncbi:MAG: Proteasome subunit alpha [Candidatus Heimdallarchaeota archaeon LC_2]|nr:MAG: Proteasome subunit alpha [Candidatus Heimdallarchaeota archaeon LC_2]